MILRPRKQRKVAEDEVRESHQKTYLQPNKKNLQRGREMSRTLKKEKRTGDPKNR